MNKRKIVMMALSIMMVAILAVGGSLAYLTDTDTKTNVFTTGKVDIALKENFEQNSKLLPGKQNAKQKEVWIELEANSEDAYVWYTFAIPTALDSTDGSTGTNNIVHVNAYGYTWDNYRENQNYWQNGQTAALPETHTWDHDPNVELEGLVGPEGYIGSKNIDGIDYNVYLVLYHGKMSHTAGGQTATTPAMSQVYLDAGVDAKLDANNNIVTDAEGNVVYVDKNGNDINFNMEDDIKIIVNAYAIQADGFADVYEAYTNNPVKLN